jgi:glycine oxidase
MAHTNTLVVGQGIAGTLVAFMLHLRGIPFIVIDPGEPNTASRVAAGMFSPISGKRLTVQPGVTEQVPFAIETYRQLESLLHRSILHLLNVYQVYQYPAQVEEVARRSASMPGQYLRPAAALLPGIRQPYGAFGIAHSGWVDCDSLMQAFAQWLSKRNQLLPLNFTYADLRFEGRQMEYLGTTFNNIVFCEGYRAINNPFFQTTKIIPCKGDILTISRSALQAPFILKKGSVYVLPTGDYNFRVGATYQWGDASIEPDPAGRKLLATELDDLLENDYLITRHQSGVRPTTSDRQAIAQAHPQHAGMFMLNGLGTRGILQAPWWAKKIIDELVVANRTGILP